MDNMDDKTILDDLPESVIIEEILIRLHAEDVLRCRVVRKSWHHATSTHEFLLAHHHKQPSLPIMEHIKFNGELFERDLFVDVGPVGANHELCHRTILWQTSTHPYEHNMVIHASCDGLLIISFRSEEGLLSICNPITRRRAPLTLLCENECDTRRAHIAGFYQHQPSGEYHVLYSTWTMNWDLFTFTIDFYIIVVGANKPRPIKQPPLQQDMMNKLTCSYNASILYSGNLHWLLRPYYNSYGSNNIMVFDTMVETFWWMCCPPCQYPWMSLLELEGVLSICGSHDGIIIDIYGMHYYETKVWSLTYRIDMMALDASPRLSSMSRTLRMIATINEHELLIEFPGCIVHCDISGKFLGKMEWNEGEDNRMRITPFRFQENICQLTFFAMEEDYGAWRMLEEERDDEKYYSIWP